MVAKYLSVVLLLAALVVYTPAAAGPQQASASEVDNAFNLFKQQRYNAAAASFEHIIQTRPSARICYYAALANRASSKEARARQLFQFLITNYSGTPEASYAQRALTQGQQLPTASSQDKSAVLPEIIRSQLTPEMQALLNTEVGKQAVKQAMKEQAANVALIRSAEQQGILTKEMVKSATQSTAETHRPNLAGDHPFSAADIARDGAAGIDQSRYPNCWFEASMSALAQLPRGQQLLASLIRRNTSDQYVVRFPNDGVEYIVSNKDLAQSGIRDNALWASIIECAQLKKFPDNQGANGADQDQSRLEIGLGCITGRKAEVIYPSTCSVQDLSSFIGGAIKSQNPIVAGTFGPPQLASLPVIVFPTHAYTVIGFDPAKDMILLRNPHGHKAKSFQLASDPQHVEFEQLSDGVFKMSLATFQKYFHSIARSFI